MKCDFCGEPVVTPAFEIVVTLPDGTKTSPVKKAHVPCALSALESGICPESWIPYIPAIDLAPSLKSLRSPKLRVV